jgi:hypothetical protein
MKCEEKQKQKHTSTSAIADNASLFLAGGTISSSTPLHAGAVPEARGRIRAPAHMCAGLVEKTRRATRKASMIILKCEMIIRLSGTTNYSK